MSSASKKRDKWPRSRYTKTVKTLKSLGYNISYSAKGQLKKQVANRVRRLFHKSAPYLAYLEGENVRGVYNGVKETFYDDKGRLRVGTESNPRAPRTTKYNFIYKKLKPSERKLFKGLVSPGQFTKGGVFIEKPAHIPLKKFKIKVSKDGITYKYDKLEDKVVRLSPRALAVNHEKALKNALARASKGPKKKPKNYRLMVNGFRGQRAFTLKELHFYVEAQLLPTFMEDEDVNEEDFADTFHISLSYK
jgi:hypothetical protein